MVKFLACLLLICKVGWYRQENIILCVSMFAKPECDNVLQPDPRISEGCSTLLDEGFAKECNIAIILYKCLLYNLGERTGLMVRASDSGSGDPGTILGRVGVLFPWARGIYSPKVLVIPRNRWLRLNMTEKLFTGTLNKNQNKLYNLRFVSLSSPEA